MHSPEDGRNVAVVGLGEVMVRLSPPGTGRLETSRTLEVDVGGGEYNVVHALARFGWPAAFVTRLPDQPLSRAVLAHARAAGVDVRHIQIVPYDGVGRSDRLGLYFAEIGAGVRGGQAVFDRGHSAAGGLGPESVDWDQVLSPGVRWFHAGGIFPVLSPGCAGALARALEVAAARGLETSYDLNFRSALCSATTAAEVNRRMLPQVTHLIGSPEGFAGILAGDEAPVERSLEECLAALRQRYPRLKGVAGTLRRVRSGSRHDLAGFLWQDGVLWRDPGFEDFEVVDRVGTGDAFSAGVIHGRLAGWTPDRTLRFALAHAVLVHTTRGDTSQFTVAEVEELAAGQGAAMRR